MYTNQPLQNPNPTASTTATTTSTNQYYQNQSHQPHYAASIPITGFNSSAFTPMTSTNAMQPVYTAPMMPYHTTSYHGNVLGHDRYLSQDAWIPSQRQFGIGMPSVQQGYGVQTYLPQTIVPSSFVPHSIAPLSFAPQGFAPQGFAPQGFATQGIASHGIAPTTTHTPTSNVGTAYGSFSSNPQMPFQFGH